MLCVCMMCQLLRLAQNLTGTAIEMCSLQPVKFKQLVRNIQHTYAALLWVAAVGIQHRPEVLLLPELLQHVWRRLAYVIVTQQLGKFQVDKGCVVCELGACSSVHRLIKIIMAQFSWDT